MREITLFTFRRFIDLQRKVAELDDNIQVINIQQTNGIYMLYLIEVNND